MSANKLSGFAKLREGRIHLRCYKCGRKMSNVERDEYDPPTAVLMETPCPECVDGMEPPTDYFDATGKQVRSPEYDA